MDWIACITLFGWLAGLAVLMGDMGLFGLVGLIGLLLWLRLTGFIALCGLMCG